MGVDVMATAGPYHIFFSLPGATSYTTEEHPMTISSQDRGSSEGDISVVRAGGNSVLTFINEYNEPVRADFNETMRDLVRAQFVDGSCGDGSSLDKRKIDNHEGVFGLCRNRNGNGRDSTIAFYWLDESNGFGRTEIRVDSTFPEDVTNEVLNTFQIR